MRTFNEIANAIDVEASNQPIARLDSLGLHTGGRRLTQTDAIITAAAAYADIEIKQLRDNGYFLANLNPVTPPNYLDPRYTRFTEAIHNAEEQERFNDD